MSKFCRICLNEDEIRSKLVSPCMCSGSIGWIHNNCFEDVIRCKQSNRCPTCLQPYEQQYCKSYGPRIMNLSKKHPVWSHFLVDVITFLFYVFWLGPWMVSCSQQQSYSYLFDCKQP